jgi:predicted metalloprotease with PDZ domain
MGGYRLVYSDEPTPFFKDNEKRAKTINLNYSLGLSVGKEAKITSVVWDGPAFDAGLTVGAQIIAVNGQVYEDEILKDAVKAAKGQTEPVKLLVKSGDRIREVALKWNGGLRYPKLEKIGKGDGSIDLLLKALP